METFQKSAFESKKKQTNVIFFQKFDKIILHKSCKLQFFRYLSSWNFYDFASFIETTNGYSFMYIYFIRFDMPLNKRSICGTRENDSNTQLITKSLPVGHKFQSNVCRSILFLWKLFQKCLWKTIENRLVWYFCTSLINKII